MSDQSPDSNSNPWNELISSLSFPRIFQGFRAAIRPSKLLLALAGILVICLGGWVLDQATPRKFRVTGSSPLLSPTAAAGAKTELDFYVQSGHQDVAAYRETVSRANETALTALLQGAPLSLDDDQADQRVRSQGHLIAKDYESFFDQSATVLERRYGIRRAAIKKDVEEEEQRRGDLEQAKEAYRSLYDALLTGSAGPSEVALSMNVLIVADAAADPDDRQVLRDDRQAIQDTVKLAQACQLAQAVAGKGIFATLVDFYAQRFHTAVLALVRLDLATLQTQVLESMIGLCWLGRFHTIFALLLLALWLATWAIFGGAICRMAALQFARDERIGPMQALKFSAGKFGSFLSAPLIPLGIILFFAVLNFFGGVLGAIPAIGEWIAAILMGLALVSGFIMALVAVGLIGGANLMYATIAVEGSDSFDAISRSFSYLFSRPWRLGFYSLLAAVYGSICYLFVRAFALILLMTVRIPAGLSMNWDASSSNAAQGKMEAIWPAPTFADLHPTINFIGLNWTERLGAFFVCLWMLLIVGLVISFLVSFYFTVNTTIYFLLRRHVDATEWDDVYINENIDDLVSTESGDAFTPEPEEEKAGDDQDSGPEAKSEPEESDD